MASQRNRSSSSDPSEQRGIELVGLQLAGAEMGARDVRPQWLSVGRRGDELGSLEGGAVDGGLLEMAPEMTSI